MEAALMLTDSDGLQASLVKRENPHENQFSNNDSRHNKYHILKFIG